MLMIYSRRERTEQPGLKVVLSEDAGDSFDNEDPLIVWDAYGKEALGVARSDTYPSSHDAIASSLFHLEKMPERKRIETTDGAFGNSGGCAYALLFIHKSAI